MQNITLFQDTLRNRVMNAVTRLGIVELRDIVTSTITNYILLKITLKDLKVEALGLDVLFTKDDVTPILECITSYHEIEVPDASGTYYNVYILGDYYAVSAEMFLHAIE